MDDLVLFVKSGGTFKTVTTTSVTIAPPAQIPEASDSSLIMQMFDCVRVANLSSAPLLVSINGAATTTNFDIAVPNLSAAVMMLRRPFTDNVQLATNTGSTLATVEFGSIKD